VEPGRLIELLGRSVAKGFWKATDSTLGKAAEGLGERVAVLLPTLLQPFLPAFAAEFTRLMIAALLQRDDDNRELQEAVNRIQEAPFRTGIEQLRLALDAPATTSAQVAHRASRFRDARNNLDLASHQSSPERRPVVDFYRGLASFHIEGAAFEAAEHWTSFGKACSERAAAIRDTARREIALAEEDESKAKAITFEHVSGGGGMATFDRAMAQAERARLLAQGKQRRAASETLTSLAAALDEASAQSGALVALAKLKELEAGKE
jgi:hypothetical protein